MTASLTFASSAAWGARAYTTIDVEKGLQVPEELTKDIRKLNEEEKKLLGIQMLPENLGEAIKAMGQDTLVSKVLGETYRKGYMKAKRKEWKDYLEQVSEWELNRYLYRV